MEKAFDRVWHAGLVHKLIATPTPRRVIRIIASFLQDRSFRVRVQDATSDSHPIRAGVPQGSCLSPILYSKYTDDIPVGEGVQLALYADDAAYISVSIKPRHAILKLQRTLDLLPQWLARWRLVANAGKTQALLTQVQASRHPKLHFMGVDVEWSNVVKYLGILIDNKINMGKQSKSAANSGRTAAYLLHPMLNSDLPVKAKLGIYKTYIRPRLTYATPAWWTLASETNKERCRVVQKKALRKIVNAPRFVRGSTIERDLRMDSLDNFTKRLTKNLFKRADSSSWEHLRGIAPYHRRPPDGKGYPRDLVAGSSDDSDGGG